MKLLFSLACVAMLLVAGPSVGFAMSQSPLSFVATPSEAAAVIQMDQTAKIVTALAALVILAVVVQLVVAAWKSSIAGIRRTTSRRFGLRHAVPQTPD